ncbi:telomere repeat-binding protein 2-like [Vicia villosa]|uniref:telomere repeat-binding protein 2-like n=1 Tax=Vicia villosa TaxID=3911 RepID=UPI00273B0FC7|nr:telomere repeat-binding protein 2-like [Vicia villosa]XP_058762121.1 telomere repeat-binding protein 2-like [Vicia villosa]
MVAQKRIDYGFVGYQVPTKPRAARSTRKRDTFQTRVENNQMCAIDLLATVASGTLLQEKHNPITSSDELLKKDQRGFVKEESQDANKPFKAELPDETSCEKRLQHGFVKEGCLDMNKPLKAELSDEGSSDRKCISTLSLQEFDLNSGLKESPRPEIDGRSCIASILTSSSGSERLVTDTLMDVKSHSEMKNISSKVELGSSEFPDCSDCNLDVDVSIVKDELRKSEMAIGTETGTHCFKDPIDDKPPTLVVSGGNAKLSEHDDSIPRSSLLKGCDNVSVVSRDDDENKSGCAHPSSKTKAFRPKTCIGDQRIRKRLASKYRKVARESKHETLSNNVLDRNFNTVHNGRKNSYSHQISQMNIPFKKRKIFDCSSTSNSNGNIRSGRTFYSTKNDISQGVSCSSSRMRKDPGKSSLEAYHHRSALKSRDSHVKLRIKSFRVPELFIEIPETATVASLKKAVMEAVTTLLRGGLRVGMILHGKKLRDDSKTLLQTGISHDNELDALGFTLEPNASQSLPLTCAKDSLNVPNGDTPLSLIGHPSSPAVVLPIQRIQGFSDTDHQVATLGNIVESDNDSAPSPINTSGGKKLSDSKELVTIPEMGSAGLDILPVNQSHQKPKRTEISQRRRIRRPFSVAEVEALVEAVERLGTGRWRDVKLRAFDDAKHRTYVDLKDKWKTLVHTARISPQQRRGEPVPQELLDRVLTAHAYWSQQQLKHHPETCLLL